MKKQPANFVAWRLILMLALVCLPLTGAMAKDDVWTPKEFIAASGIDKALAAITKGMRDAVNAPELDQAIDAEKLKEVWPEAVETTFSEKHLEDGFIEQLSGKITPKEYQAIRQFLESDFGRRVTRLEVDAHALDVSELNARGAEVAKSIAPDRIRVIKEMIDAIGGVESGLTIAMNSSFAMLKGMQAGGAIPLQLPDEDIRKFLKESEPKMRQEIGALLALSTAYTYKDLSDEELKFYVDFLNSPAGKAMYKKSLTALDAMLSERMVDFGNTLMTLMGHRKS